ncbi:lycopene cyclase domain-containing protein [Actinosynnema sp. NPDC047251]|uniref:Lycopene cyclase domain protein n=1 Tax=Saccharothrix espanaensis (strain ATCC 51144 / DSM 44229 / JCM 9112 / NBRC 15066 / NRRL 15764) TaxID=1179773 RepID=K0JWW4_SACES|nr:lycopene cyclase domain-containing protein [Saccharothrix espanaensis]CCH32355.1 Lycopene cyclase domain protein [Saccharothrix espanaensis DSM 44229]
MPEYLVAALLSVVVVVVLELAVLRTGLFRNPVYWAALAIMFAFQVPVDGWLTKLDAPVVRYADWAISGVRFPWDIPVEDFLFAFSMITLTLALWERRKETAR